MKIIATLNSFLLLVGLFMSGCHEAPVLETKPLPKASHGKAAKNVMPDTAGWASQALHILQEQEYAIHYNEAAKQYASPNHRQHMRAQYAGHQLTLASEAGSPRDWTLNLQLHGIYAGSDLQYEPLSTARAKVEGNAIEFDHNGAFTVQYINSQEGVRQNFIVQQQPQVEGNLAVHLSVNKGWTVEQAGSGELHFMHRQSGSETRKELAYHSLKVWDAQNKKLDAWFTKDEGSSTFTIEVNTKDAVYPVTIDPLSTTEDWAVDGSVEAGFGMSISSAGDVNGDGYSDVIVGEPEYAGSNSFKVGRVHVYYGSKLGLPLVANWVAEGTALNGKFGNAVASAGDVNGDGYSDVIIGAVEESRDHPSEGAAYLYYGSAAGLENSPAWRVESNNNLPKFGQTVASAGDVNGDGYSDVMVASPYQNAGTIARAGMVFIYYGSRDGVSETPDVSLEGEQPQERLGSAIGAAGDVNGDGYSDIIIGSPDYNNASVQAGRAQIYYGSNSGIDLGNKTLITGFNVSAQLGASVAGIGDVNGDGFADVLIGAPKYSNGEENEGAVFLYFGSSAGIGFNPAWQLESNMENRQFGAGVKPAGDVDGDGFADAMVLLSGYDTAYVYKGSSAGLENTAYWKFGRAHTTNKGISGASAGDVNGDGYSDLIVGFYTQGQVRGFYGGADGLETGADFNLTTDQPKGNMGYSVSTAGDVNGDGYDDVVVGVPGYGNGQVEEGAIFIYYGTSDGIPTTPSLIIESDSTRAWLGNCVAGAGDVNGDGYADVIAGAFHYGVPSTRGAVFIYYGSAQGLDPNPGWMVTGPSNGYEFGTVVTGIGDVNGDGYADISVGTPTPVPGWGAVSVYYGSETGPATTADWSFSGNVPDSYVGYSITAAGDVNGDGYDDMALSAPYMDGNPSIGHIYIFHGSGNGLSHTPDRTIEGGPAAGTGFIVKGAGDVDGDGFSDLLVSDPQYNDVGRVAIFYGSADGIPLGVFETISINKSQSLFGVTLASAGDVNGDGYSDVIVGAPGLTNSAELAGGAYVFLGGAEGISTSPAWQYESDQGFDFLGSSVSSAGDINGDGLSDIIVGAPNNSNPQGENGRAVVYMGNAGGLRNNLRLYNTDQSTPIQQSNIEDVNFGAGFFARSPMGRIKARLVWEAQPEGHPFGSRNHGGYVTGKTGYTDLGTAGRELKTLITKAGKQTKLRVRLEYRKTTSLNGQVMGPWRYPAGYLQGVNGMSNAPLPVTLERFTAKYQPTGDVLLEWRSAMEENSHSFEIQRSVNGRDFTTIGQVKAAGMAAGYNYTDYSVDSLGVRKLFYRLRMIDIDQTAGVSKIVPVDLPMPGAFAIRSVYPNPASDYINISLNSPESDNVLFTVFDVAGRPVKQQPVSITQGVQSIQINTSDLPAGVYVLRMQSRSTKQHAEVRFIKE